MRMVIGESVGEVVGLGLGSTGWYCMYSKPSLLLCTVRSSTLKEFQKR